MKKTFTFITMMFLCALLPAQTVSVTFTGHMAENDKNVPLSYIIVQNQTRGWAEALLWPDTVMVVTNVTGVEEWQKANLLALSQYTPNPFSCTTDVQLAVAEPGNVSIEITDILGRVVASKNLLISQSGIYQFHVSLPLAGTYLMSVRQNDHSASIKMIGSGGNGTGNSIEYVGSVGQMDTPFVKYENNEPKDGNQHPFVPGDMMNYQGFAYNTDNQLMCSAPVQQTMGNMSQNITLEFTATTVINYQPCPGMPIVTDVDGNYYNTLQLGQQCWMHENLRTTHYANGSPIPSGSDISYTEPRFYINPSVDAAQYGYYYNWHAAMNGASSSNSIPSGVQGVCPNGWHLPSDTEWAQLVDYIRMQSEYLCNSNNVNIAKSLASETYWHTSTEECVPGNDMSSNNASGFAAVPAGYYNSMFGAAAYNAFFWASTEFDQNHASNRYLVFEGPDVYRLENGAVKMYGWSVRCLRD